MTRLNIHEAKTHLSKYLNRVRSGETILICKNDTPIAMLTPLPAKSRSRKNFWGLAKGKIEMTPEFFEPMSEDDFIAGRIS